MIARYLPEDLPMNAILTLLLYELLVACLVDLLIGPLRDALRKSREKKYGAVLRLEDVSFEETLRVLKYLNSHHSAAPNDAAPDDSTPDPYAKFTLPSQGQAQAAYVQGVAWIAISEQDPYKAIPIIKELIAQKGELEALEDTEEL
jgi:hypothetical protein